MENKPWLVFVNDPDNTYHSGACYSVPAASKEDAEALALIEHRKSYTGELYASAIPLVTSSKNVEYLCGIDFRGIML